MPSLKKTASRSPSATDERHLVVVSWTFLVLVSLYCPYRPEPWIIGILLEEEVLYLLILSRLLCQCHWLKRHRFTRSEDVVDRVNAINIIRFSVRSCAFSPRCHIHLGLPWHPTWHCIWVVEIYSCAPLSGVGNQRMLQPITLLWTDEIAEWFVFSEQYW